MRTGLTGLALAAVMAAGAGGYWAGHRGVALPPMPWLGAIPWLANRAAPPASASPASSEPVVYYRDPDGKPLYAGTPRRTADGRDFLPVRASEELSFDTTPPKAATAAASSDPSSAPGSKRILYYRNPMGLADTSREPKKDSMGMDYIPVYEGGDDDSKTVNVSLGKLQRSGVRSEPAEQRILSLPIRASGTIQLDERRIVVVATRSDAFVEQVSDITTGERVSKGQALLRLYSPDISKAGAEYLTELGSAGHSFPTGGARKRLENLGVPLDAIDEIKRTGQVPLGIAWTAPRDGIVIERNAIEGMKVGPGDVLFRLADITTVWALIDVAERDLPMIAGGQTVRIVARGFVDQVFTGKISVIYPQVNRETRTTRVRVELANPAGILRPDMYVDAEIATGAGIPVTAVPASSVIDSGARQIVIVDKGEGRFEPMPVKLGRRNTDFIEIREGISAGDKVVVSANFLIDAESNLKAALSGLGDPEQAK